MTRKVNKNKFPEFDKFDRKQKKRANSKKKSSNPKLSIYTEFEEEDFEEDYSSTSDFDDE